jgi:hypothetical protein
MTKINRLFQPFLTLMEGIADPRRAQGKMYRLPHLVLFAIFAVLSGANSYRTIHTFIEAHLKVLKKAFGLTWKRAPCVAEVWFALSKLDAANVEGVFRDHAALLIGDGAGVCIGMDGKTLRGSFDGMLDVRARQILSAFAVGEKLILAHIDIDDKSNEIPAAQKLFEDLNLKNRLVTLDALHCQKKHSKPPPKPKRISSSS